MLHMAIITHGTIRKITLQLKHALVNNVKISKITEYNVRK